MVNHPWAPGVAQLQEVYDETGTAQCMQTPTESPMPRSLVLWC